MSSVDQPHVGVFLGDRTCMSKHISSRREITVFFCSSIPYFLFEKSPSLHSPGSWDKVDSLISVWAVGTWYALANYTYVQSDQSIED